MATNLIPSLNLRTYRSKNGIKICDEASVGEDNCSYLVQGRAVLNGFEIMNFKNHLEEHMDHETFLIFVSWESLLRRDVVHVCNMFCNTIQDAKFVGSLMIKDKAIEIIQDIANFHGLTAEGKVKDGFIILTDEKSVLLKKLMASPTALDEAKEDVKVLATVTDKFSIPIVVDSHLCARSYKNTQIKPANFSRGTKRPALDDTFTTELQEQRRQPLPLEEKVTSELRKTKLLVRECQKQAEAVIFCTDQNRDQLVWQLEGLFTKVEESLELLDGTLNHVKSDAINEVNELKQKLKEAKSTKEWAENELIKYENEAENLNKTHEKSIQKLQNRLNEISIKHQAEQENKDHLLEAAKEGQKDLLEQIEDMNLKIY